MSVVIITSVTCTGQNVATVGTVDGVAATAMVALAALTGTDNEKKAVIAAALIARCPAALALTGTVTV